MRSRVIVVTGNVFVVKIKDDSYSIIELPPIANIRDIYKESDVEVPDEVQGELFTEGATELFNVTRNRTLKATIRKSPATKYDLVAFINNP